MKNIFMCIGNPEGGDDGIGPYIADLLKKRKTNNFKVLDCKTTPENFTSIVKRYYPENVFLIDAIDMHLNPGEYRLVPKEKIGTMHITTHGIPLSILINYLERNIENVSLIGIQPKKMDGEMTNVVKEAGEKLTKILLKDKMKDIPPL